MDQLKYNATSSSYERLIAMENKLDCLREEEEIYWKMRSREEWLKWGDKNTQWFHSKANYRKKSNKIEGILNRDGVWVDKEEDVK